MSPRKSYTPTPQVPPELMPRLAAIIEVLAGLKAVSEAARTLGLSRNHFQSILHRALFAMVQTITVKAGGRPAKADSLLTLERQVRALQRENARLQRQIDSTQRVLELAGGLLKGRLRPSARQRRARKRTGGNGEGPEESEPERSRAHILQGVNEMHRLGIPTRLAAALAGVDVATLRRWRSRARRWVLLTAHRHLSRAPVTGAAATRAIELVRSLHGLIGVESLRHSVVGLTRRAAAELKRATLSALERERKSALMRIRITQPGVLRGFDAMHFAASDGAFYALIGGDAAVPYRTSVQLGSRCDAEFVARTLTLDFERHGAPLVLRFDRARAHDAPAVHEVLEGYRVLTLHGPPHYPCFYGQLERQNREHRAWLATSPPQSRASLEPCLREMLECVNALWRRRTLAWQTASEVWHARPTLAVDRDAFREEVNDRARRIAHRLKRRTQPADLPKRLAIQQTLERMGYLRQELGGWC